LFSALLIANERTVVVAQYLRVALVVLTMPLVVTYLFAADTTAQTASNAAYSGVAPWWVGAAFLVAATVAGTGIAALIRLPIPATLGPLLLTAALELCGCADGIVLPAAVMPAAFLIIGWQAGLSFQRSSIAVLGRVFVWVFVLMAAVIAACAGLGVLLSLWTGVNLL
jgi:uncharacterized membrane protein AbrB (regulator of aidB expression)